LERFKHPALAAAAYNGGPGAVSRWVKAGGSQPLDLFVEKIPYKETRRYVKAVLTDLHLYRAFYGQEDKAAPLSLVLPSPTDKGVDF
jgi:soluble lytic murein transglycosylase